MHTCAIATTDIKTPHGVAAPRTPKLLGRKRTKSQAQTNSCGMVKKKKERGESSCYLRHCGVGVGAAGWRGRSCGRPSGAWSSRRPSAPRAGSGAWSAPPPPAASPAPAPPPAATAPPWPSLRSNQPEYRTSLLTDVDRPAGQAGPRNQRDPDATGAMRLVRGRYRTSLLRVGVFLAAAPGGDADGARWEGVSPSAALSVVRWQLPPVITLVVRVGLATSSCKRIWLVVSACRGPAALWRVGPCDAALRVGRSVSGQGWSGLGMNRQGLCRVATERGWGGPRGGLVRWRPAMAMGVPARRANAKLCECDAWCLLAQGSRCWLGVEWRARCVDRGTCRLSPI